MSDRNPDALIKYIKNFKKAISNSGKTQAELAKEIGVSTSTLSEWMRGRYFPKQDKIDTLAQSLGISPSQLRDEIAEARMDETTTLQYSIKEINQMMQSLKKSLNRDVVKEDDSPYLTNLEKNIIENRVHKELPQSSELPLENIVEEFHNPAFQLWSYPYIPEPVTRTILNDSNCVNRLPRITLPDSMMGQYAKKNNVVLLSMPDRGMNKIFKRLALLGVDVDADIKKLDGEIVAYWRHNKFFVRRMFLIKNEDKYIMRPESRIPVFVDTVLKPDEFELIGKVVMYTNTI